VVVVRVKRVVAAVLLAVLPLLISQSPAAAATGCPGADVPPAPAAVEEAVPGAVTPAPLPWPLPPVGGAALDACGDVVGTGDPALPADVTAAGFVLADLDTGAVLAARAPHARQRPASTLKVLTAMVVIDRLDPDAQVAGAPEDLSIDGSRAGIGPGGTYTVRQLPHGPAAQLGQRHGQALARTMGGDAATVAAMADKARQLGRLDTRPGDTVRARRAGHGDVGVRPGRAVPPRDGPSRCSRRRSRHARSRSPGTATGPGSSCRTPTRCSPATRGRWAARPASPTPRGTRSSRPRSATGGGWWCRWCAPRTHRS
jgi:hypothetical protein